MPDAKTTNWIKVDDFSPGIVQATASGVATAGAGTGTPQPLGSAASHDSSGVPITYDCVSLPGNHLGAAPFYFFHVFTGAINPAWAGPSPAPDLGLVKSSHYAVGGLHITPFQGADPGTPLNSLEAAFVILVYSWDDGAGGPAYPRRYRLYTSDVTGKIEIGGPGAVFPFYQTPGRGNVQVFGFTPMCDYRSSGAAAPTVPGQPLLIIGVCDTNIPGVNVWRYPGIAGVPHLDNYRAIKNAVHLVSHQGRLLVNGQDTTFTFGGINVLHNDDNYWTVPNQDPYDNAGVGSSFSQASVGSYGLIVSQSANELLIIRTTPNGGLTISSDLNDPIITDYATMQGTNGCHIDGCWTPSGFIFPTLDGSVYAYIGGGQTKDVATQMDWGFWGPTSTIKIGQGPIDGAFRDTGSTIIPYKGQCAYISGYALIPGNWLLDTIAGAWWRFRTPTDAFDPNHFFNSAYYSVGPTGNIYASPPIWDDGSNQLISVTPFGKSAGDYVWTSNLIPMTTGSELAELREFILEGISYGGALDTDVVIVDIQVFPSGQTFSHTFTLVEALQAVESFRISIPSMNGTHLQVKLSAVNFPNIPAIRAQAPTITRFELGVAQTTKINNSI